MINKLLGFVLKRLPENNRIERIWKLAQIDFKKRYYNDRLGLFWALLNPMFRIAIYYFVFKIILKIREDNYALFLFSGLLIWMAFVEASKMGMKTLKAKAYLLENIQFQKIDLFYSSVLSVFLGLSFNLLAYFGIAIMLNTPLGWNLLYLPIVLATVFLICFGTAMILSTVTIYLQDMAHVWDVLIVLGFWTSGIFFRGDMILDKIPISGYLNPFIGIIKNIRSILLFNTTPDFFWLSFDFGYAFVISIVGYQIMQNYSQGALERL